MLELNASPNPSPVLPATNSASSADASRTESANPGNAESPAPFAAVLQRQINQPAHAKATDSNIRRTAVIDTEAAAAAPAETPVDALAILATMLAGIAPAQPVAAQAATTEGVETALDPEDENTADTAAIIPTALPVAANTAPVVLATTEAGEKPASATSILDLPRQPSAILAGTSSAVAESSAETGKTGTPNQNFDALLNAARETQIMAGQNVATAHTAPTSPSTNTATTTVATPVGAHGWDKEVGEKVAWMVGRLESRADIVLNPPQMGRIEVSLSINGDQATATFVSANPAVRDALENALPRLREILQDAGISLGQTQVGAESFQQSANNRENGDNSFRGNGRHGDSGTSATEGLLAGNTAPAQWLRRGSGLVDTFA